MRILLTGGTGKLGKELLAYFPDAFTPTHTEMDLSHEDLGSEYIIKNSPFDICIHSAADIHQSDIERDGSRGLYNNIFGTYLLTDMTFMGHIKKLIYISTEYVYDSLASINDEESPINPKNRYIWSKIGGEACVRMLPVERYCIIRSAFSADEWTKDYAYADQITSRQKVSTIARKIAFIVKNNGYGTFNVGGRPITTYAYAKTVSNKKLVVKYIRDADIPLPKLCAMDTTKFKDFVKKNK